MPPFLLFLFLFFFLFGQSHAGTCKGETPCQHCKTCKSCRYCRSGKGSCNVAREQADREYEAKQKKVSG